jgi:hypothetical protein
MKSKSKQSAASTEDQHVLEHIRKRAYELWEASGRQQGNDMANWIQAEQEVRARRKPRPRAG